MHATMTTAHRTARPTRSGLTEPMLWKLELAHDPQLIITACILLAFVAGVLCFGAVFARGIDALALAGV